MNWWPYPSRIANVHNTHTHTHTHTYTHTHTCAHARTHARMHACMPSPTQISACVHTHTPACLPPIFPSLLEKESEKEAVSLRAMFFFLSEATKKTLVVSWCLLYSWMTDSTFEMADFSCFCRWEILQRLLFHWLLDDNAPRRARQR